MFNSDFWFPLKLSVQVSLISAFFVFLFGIIIAKLMSGPNFKGKTLLETAFLLPIVLPPTVIGFLLIVLLGPHSPAGALAERIIQHSIMFTAWAAVLASSVVAFPLMYQTAKNGFQSVEKEIEEAARVDGAGELLTFLYVSLPLSYKAIISGTILSFARALGEFGATFMFAGNIPGKTQTASTAIYIAMDSGDMKTAWTYVICMIAISSIMLFTTNLVKK
ncbi:molybdate ABC transporter permease subunit [Bacillus sp. C11]|nr:molybdate ABC transporter permease subunit [Neobacillus terrae]NHM29412.1 molybdate ABC transporter permease subunit [Neobacillus terrae]